MKSLTKGFNKEEKKSFQVLIHKALHKGMNKSKGGTHPLENSILYTINSIKNLTAKKLSKESPEGYFVKIDTQFHLTLVQYYICSIKLTRVKSLVFWALY